MGDEPDGHVVGSDLVRFETVNGSALLVEVDEQAFGLERIARNDNGVIEAGKRLDEALAAARPTIRAVIDALREFAPDEHEVEFGIKLNAGAGVAVAKTAVEAHFNVRLVWRRATAASR
ncbi:MAG: CU044_2847 family protein [Egibacteraceae bacterium]